MTEIHEIISERWSPREYDPAYVVTKEQTEQVLEAARWAPSAMNKQEWWFIVGLKGDENFKKLVDAANGYSDWALDASALILNIYQPFPSERHGVDFGPYDLGAAVQNMLLQATAMGLFMRPFASFDKAKVREQFSIPEPYVPFTMSTLGLAKASKPERQRKPLSQLYWSAI